MNISEKNPIIQIGKKFGILNPRILVLTLVSIAETFIIELGFRFN